MGAMCTLFAQVAACMLMALVSLYVDLGYSCSRVSLQSKV